MYRGGGHDNMEVMMQLLHWQGRGGGGGNGK